MKFFGLSSLAVVSVAFRYMPSSVWSCRGRPQRCSTAYWSSHMAPLPIREGVLYWRSRRGRGIPLSVAAGHVCLLQPRWLLWKSPIAAGRQRAASQSPEAVLTRYQRAGVAPMIYATECFHACKLRLFRCSKFDMSPMSDSDQNFSTIHKLPINT